MVSLGFWGSQVRNHLVHQSFKWFTNHLKDSATVAILWNLPKEFGSETFPWYNEMKDRLTFSSFISTAYLHISPSAFVEVDRQ